MTKKRLSKALAAAGIASRRAAEELIFSGRVMVNGQICVVPQTMVAWDEDHIKVDGSRVSGEENKVCYILNKPKGYLCTSAPEVKRRVIDLVDDRNSRLFTVGRLDKETTGMIIVTNDGAFANRVIHPSSNVHKEYVAKTNKEIMEEHLEILRKGTHVEGTFVKPVKVTKIRRGTVKVVVREGKKREVRIMLENAGFEVLELERTRIGNLRLGTLPVGASRPMTAEEKEMIFE